MCIRDRIKTFALIGVILAYGVQVFLIVAMKGIVILKEKWDVRDS